MCLTDQTRLRHFESIPALVILTSTHEFPQMSHRDKDQWQEKMFKLIASLLKNTVVRRPKLFVNFGHIWQIVLTKKRKGQERGAGEMWFKYLNIFYLELMFQAPKLTAFNFNIN